MKALDVIRGERQWAVETGDCIDVLRSLPDGCVHCCATSPPYYGLRDYGVAGQIGLEETPDSYVAKLVEVFGEVWRVLRDDGTVWANLGDSYAGGGGGNYTKGTRNTSGQNVTNARNRPEWMESAGAKPKNLLGIPWRVALALQAAGWYLRAEIIWAKRAPMPESVRDRPTRAHEQVFLLTKRPTYYYDAEAVRETLSTEPHAPGNLAGRDGGHLRNDFGTDSMQRVWGDPAGRNLRSVWTLSPEPCPEAHFATFPSEIPRRCIAAGTSERGCCPTCGAPWRRVVERDRQPTRPGTDSKVFHGGTKGTPPGQNPHSDQRPRKQDARQQISGGDRMTGFNERWESAKVGNRDPERHCTETRTVGWEPGCKCGTADPIPCTVLDPFGGAGTTLLVAKLMGRRGIAAELNPDYAEMARKRIARGGDLPRQKDSSDDSPTLFDFAEEPQ